MGNTLWGLSRRRVALRTATTHCTGTSGHSPGSQEKAEKPVVKIDISWAMGTHRTGDQDAGKVDVSFTTHMLAPQAGTGRSESGSACLRTRNGRLIVRQELRRLTMTGEWEMLGKGLEVLELYSLVTMSHPL